MAKGHKADKSNNAVIIWTIVALFGVFIISQLIFSGIGTIEYNGLTFTKEQFGKIPVYHYSYVYADSKGELVQNNVYLRENPKKNDVPIEGNITYLPKKFAYVSINATALSACNNSGVAISTLASFLSNGGIMVRGATLEDNSTLNSSTLHITCETNPYNPVIQIDMGNETRVLNQNLCYNIRAATCEDVQPAIEKFIVESIIQAKEDRAAN